MYSFIFTLGLGQPADSRKSEAGNTEATSAEVSPSIFNFLARWNNFDRVNMLIPVFSGTLASL